MASVWFCAVILVSFNLGNSLGNTKNQSPSKERYSFFDSEFVQALEGKEESNVLVSPVAVKLMLGMILEGAEGKTAEEITTALRLPHDIEKSRKEFEAWVASLQVKQPPTVLVLASQVFLSSRYRANPEYGKILEDHYKSGVTNVGFEDRKEATRMINTWVSNQTSDVIKKIVGESDIAADVKMVMSSTVYFKGVWSSPFVKERTSVRCFYPRVNECRDAVTMRKTGYFDYGYVSRLDAHVIKLPYQGGKFSMLVLLPSKKNGVRELCRDLVHMTLRSIRSDLRRQEVFVEIPKFQIGYDTNLVESLKKVGISQIFGPSANISKIFASGTAFVSRIIHSARIMVDEEGTEAAAATGALFVPLMGGTTTSFVANRPFLFLVTDSTSILFAGKVLSPEAPPERKNDTADLKKPFGKVLKENPPTPSATPKFRSIETSDYNNSHLKNFGSDHLYDQFITGREKIKKKTGKIEGPKNRKRQQALTDDWRRHGLVFA